MRIAGLSLLLGLSVLHAQDFALHQVATGFSNPLDMTFPEDGSGRIFVVEQGGLIRVVRNGQVLGTPLLDWRNRVTPGAAGEQGLLGIALPPGFQSKRYFYINYTNEAGNTRVSRVRLTSNDDVADPASAEEILAIAQPFANHNGGGLVFGPDGFLYIGTGDGGSGGDPNNNGQNPNTLLGKMLRIDTEGGQRPYGVPPNNPFVSRMDVRPEIWAIGLRNPWRYSFDRETRDLWIADVGQNRAEEVSFQAAASTGGENYGWRITEGAQCFSPASGCNTQGLTLPVLEYTRDQGVSITGGFVYRGSRNPALRGTYIYGDFGSGRIWGLTRTGGNVTNRLLLDTGRQVSTFGQDPNGEIYVAHYGGQIFALTSGAPQIRPQDGVVNAASFGAGLVPGSLATIFGTGIAPLSGILQASAFPLPTEINGTSVTINGTAVPLIATAFINGQEQINLQLPWELAGQTTANIVVRSNGRTTTSMQVTLTPTQPEIFVTTRGPGGLTIWATGLGPVNTPQQTGRAAASAVETASRAEVTLDGQPLAVTYSGLAPNFAGLYQINVTAPADARGNVVIRVGAAQSRPYSLQ